MIDSFGDRRTEDLYHGRETSRSRRVSAALREATLFKLDMLNAATSISDLRSPPSNRLEKLRGELRDFHSIRVNDQRRVIFRWTNGEASAVRLIDYH
jgi:proteic killer suppression protein